jgi:hypothetical protein
VNNQAEASFDLQLSNIHKESSVKMLYKKNVKSKNFTYIHLVSKDGRYQEEEFVDSTVIVEDWNEVILNKDENGRYSGTFPVELLGSYEATVVIEYEGLVYQEALNNFYVPDDTAINPEFFIEHTSYDSKNETMQMFFAIFNDYVPNNKVDQATLNVYEDDKLIDSVEYTDILNEMLQSKEDWYEVIEQYEENPFIYEMSFSEGSERVFLFSLKDQYGRITEKKQIVRMVK